MKCNRLAAVCLLAIGLTTVKASNIFSNAIFGGGSDASEHPDGANGTLSANGTTLNGTALNMTGLNSTLDFVPHGKVHILIQRIFLIPVDDNETNDGFEDDEEGGSDNIPDIEFHKLKESAKFAGLSDEKSNRLVRAAKLSNVSYPELTELRTMLSNSSTSANYADKARIMLEENLMQHQVRAHVSGHQEITLPVSQSAETTASESTNSIQTIEGKLDSHATSKPVIDAVTLKRLQVSAQLAGLNPLQMQRLVQAIQRANLNTTQVAELQKAIVNHAPSADDLTTLAKILGWKTNDIAGALKSNLFNPDGPSLTAESFNRTARAAGDALSSLFTSPRLCGFRSAGSRRWSNGNMAAPNQYPWSVAVLASDSTFLCAGVLVSESMVLTTASCIMKYRRDNLPLKLVLGAWDMPVNSNRDNWLPSLEIFARSAIVHSEYQEGNSDLRHNIGLVRLTQPVDFDLYPHIFPICLINEEIMLTVTTDTTTCAITGWPGVSLRSGQRPAAVLLSVSEVKNLLTGCPAATGSCARGEACTANEGSPVICPGSTPERFYLRSIVAMEPNCDPRSTAVVSTISISENFSFLAQYLTLHSS